MKTLAKLDPTSLAQHVEAVVARLEDSEDLVREVALQTLRKLKPATLAQHAEAFVARLEDSYRSPDPACPASTMPTCARHGVRVAALETLGKLEPASFAQHAHAVVRRLEDIDVHVRRAAELALRSFPPYVIRPGDLIDTRSVRSRYLGRIEWYRCRLRLRVRSPSLYWYALPYRPGGPGHARDLEIWDQQMNEAVKRDVREPTTEGARKKRRRT